MQVGLVCERVFGDRLLDALSQQLELFTRGTVGHLDQQPLSAHRAQAKVFDGGVDDVVIGDRHQRIIRRADAGAAEPDILDRALGPADRHQMTDAKRLFDHDQHRAEQVCETVTRRQCDRQAADTQPGEDRIGRESRVRKPLEPADRSRSQYRQNACRAGSADYRGCGAADARIARSTRRGCRQR